MQRLRLSRTWRKCRSGTPPVDLIDGDELCDLLKEYGLGVSVEERVVEEVTVEEEFFDSI